MTAALSAGLLRTKPATESLPTRSRHYSPCFTSLTPSLLFREVKSLAPGNTARRIQTQAQGPDSKGDGVVGGG